MVRKASLIVLLAIFVVATGSTGYSAERLNIHVSSPSADVRDVPVCVDVDLRIAGKPDDMRVEVRNSSNGDTVPGQIVLSEDGKMQLWWVIGEAKKGQGSDWIAKIDPSIEADWDTFSWKDKAGRWLDLERGGRPVTRFMYEYDESTNQRRFETYKPFLHVYGINGQRLTNGPDGESPYIAKDILYPHHRGIFIGWNKLSCGGKQYDLWHMPNVEQVCQEVTGLAAGPVLARSKAVVVWRDAEDKPIIAEDRITTVYRQDDPIWTLIDVVSKLKAVGGDVKLNGDPEHAGFQYRASDAVAKGPKEGKAQYLFHKDGIDAHKDQELPWVGLSYKLGINRYSVLHMDHADNPGPNKYSAYRDYGRFGVFFVTDIPAGETLVLKYRIWVTHIALNRSMCEAKSRVFNEPLKARVVTR